MAEMTRSPGDTARGLGVALAVVGAWAGGLVVLLSTPLGAWPPGLLPAALLVQTFLYTGLFITAHDAMHGTVCPRWPWLNDAIGTVAVGVYALFDFRALRRAHHQHHAAPASAGDPDYHREGQPGPLRWYLAFMVHYLHPLQFLGMGLIFQVFTWGLGLPPERVLLCWVAPSLLSTLQLFFVGTYLPHREHPGEPHADAHRARTLDWPPWLSLLACYHFGYHHEHHDRPAVPWWRLPRAWREAKAKAA